jgi:hypothetical protein
MSGYRAGYRSAEQVATELQITPRRVRQLYAQYVEACANGFAQSWVPGRSGGRHQKVIPDEVDRLWRKLLEVKPPASYSFAASEACRQCEFTTDRATVRRWAMQVGLEHGPRVKRPAGHVRRWQCGSIGELWQLDACTHRWFGPEQENVPLLNMIDDCSRVLTGSRLYPREVLLAYLDFLPRAFEAYGLPLALYVDQHSFFLAQIPDALTYLGEALHFYDVSFRYAPTAQAKGYAA